MSLVDRRHYLPLPSQAYAYEDAPQALGAEFAGATISAPHMHAAALEHLAPALGVAGEGGEGGDVGAGADGGRGRRVLDVGSGSGYLTHAFAALGGERCTVVGVDHLPSLVALAKANMSRSADGRRRLAEGQVRFVLGDGRRGYVDPLVVQDDADEAADGDGEQGGWDVIHVGAAAAEVHPELLRQLRRGGRMFIPVVDEKGGGAGGTQTVWLYQKDAQGKVRGVRIMGVRYVPLTDQPREEHLGG